MKSAVIIGGGQFPRKAFPRFLVSEADIVVCCDGAARNYLRNFPDRTPDMIIGDLDSLSGTFLESYEGQWLKVSDQETNDQTKAFDWLIQTHPDISEIHFIGATGKRADHTIANLSLLTEYAARTDGRISIDSVNDNETAFPMLDSGSFLCGKGRPVSIFSPDNTLKIKSAGLEWPTDNVIFDNWWKASLNRASADQVTLTFNHPSKVLVILGD